ncbi:hypothetical protein P153DRAFT_329293 [Dothidotthia symphoricarpi CBS 119687]|uniref:MYND-type domain-containing protein n=1 Tax=Dothidotthia symphoricarpi CBS 119687 TaxID=1392245 RepID=A0A6A6ASR8_9PLEO|nr:uncharacterized protein P153DRAFT_329293 [Dothidotthia symphoricarpi CBS 119687]KAF2134700.1 hypothetical protein P153DRAFT_329293 [Dothidotthia symphoricarpi CBS 119687]
MADSTETNSILCAMCTEVGTKVCSGCHEIRYCSKQCQKSDWPIHKLLCKTLDDFSDDKRPQKDGREYKRGIYFPKAGETPHFVWLPFYGDPNTGTSVLDTAAVPELMEGLESIERWCIGDNQVLHRELDRHLHLATREQSFNRDQPSSGTPNKSLEKVDQELSDWFKGPILAFGSEHGAKWPHECYDLGPMDFRHLVDCLRVNHYGLGFEEEYVEGKGEKVVGVRLNCVGDENITLRDSLESVGLSKSICDSESHMATSVAERVGVSLVVRKIPLALGWRDRTFLGMPTHHNCGAAELDVDGDKGLWRAERFIVSPKTPQQLLRSMRNATPIGTLVVARRDGQPLKLALLMGIRDYTVSKARTTSTEGISIKEWTEKVLDSVSKEEFQVWYADYVCELLNDPHFDPQNA